MTSGHRHFSIKAKKVTEVYIAIITDPHITAGLNFQAFRVLLELAIYETYERKMSTTTNNVSIIFDIISIRTQLLYDIDTYII